MEKAKIIETINKVKENSKPRKFNQTFDLIFNLKDIDLKKTDNHIDFFMQLPHKVKDKKICALVAGELIEQANEVCDKAILLDDFEKLDKKEIKKIGLEYDFFIAQANIMAKVAQYFGRVLGPLGKMPNPKAGCVVPPKGDLKPLYEKLQNTIKVSIKKELAYKVAVGKEDGNQDYIAENILTVYNQLIHHLPNEKNNIKLAKLKLTMSTPVVIG